jgi:hypothetical protein
MVAILTLPGEVAYRDVEDSDAALVHATAAAIDAAVGDWLDRAGAASDRLVVTFATESFEPGLRALVGSLRKVSDLPILVLALGAWRFEHEAPHVAVLRVPALARSGVVPPHLKITLSKLWVFALTRPRRVAYLDADCVVVRDIEGLFDGDGFNAVPDIFLHYGRRPFNSGVFAFSPQVGLRAALLARLPSLSAGDGDQSVLNAFFPDWRPLPLGYNFLRTYALVRAQAREQGLRILHYTLQRPWSSGPRSPRDYALAPLDELWTEAIGDREYHAVARSWKDEANQIDENMRAWAEGPLREKLRRGRRRARYWIAALVLLASPRRC